MMKIVIICMIYGLVCFLLGLAFAGVLANHKIKTMREEAGLDMHPKDDKDPLKDWNELFESQNKKD